MVLRVVIRSKNKPEDLFDKDDAQLNIKYCENNFGVQNISD